MWIERNTRGSALVIVLAFVVLLSGLVIAYLSRTTTDRQLARSSFDNTAADILARSALDIVVGDLKKEIFDDSTGTGPYVPKANADVIPKRRGDFADVPNLIRRSFRSDGSAIPSQASAVSSSDVSYNGRSVTPARWNKHYLIPRLNSGSTEIDTTPVTSFDAPDWVFVSGAGPIVVTSPDSSVFGRYAYAVYDQGGLLDLNVAGFPSADSTDPNYLANIGKKGVLAFADLTATGLSIGAINNIIGWRNYLTGNPTGSYSSFSFPPNPSDFVTYFLNRTRNFGIAAIPATYSSGSKIDQSLINRTELLELRRTLLAVQDAMQYLGTFSRETNHSTWSDSITRLSGRFPLSRFDLFDTTPPSLANAALIQQYFGLVYVPASGSPTTPEHWQYNGTTPGSDRQASIAALTGTNQDPHLFTLLKYALPSASDSELLSIGASLIDQRDSDQNTTWVEFGDPLLPAEKAFGVDTIPPFDPLDPRPASPPVMLNRSFRNVGDLGYAYRNSSTTLDFRTAGSADAPLLDLFSYNTASPRSGIVNLNTRNVRVLASIIKGAFQSESSTVGITEADAISASTTIVDATMLQPALGRQDIARLAGLVTSAPFSTNEEANETIARALAEVSQTRTWNLMIDMIAQSGRYPPNVTLAPDLSKFVVQGEKRYWLHIAIDRFTGEVVDQQLEAVYE